MESQSETTQTVYALKLPILKIGDYDLWSMRMEQYPTHTDYALWEVIVNGDAPTAVASASIGAEGPIPPKTVEEKLARKNELKAKSTLLLAIPDEHLLNSSSNSQNVAFVSSDNFRSTNETVNTAHSVSAASSKDQASTASYADDVMFFVFANQSNAPQLDYEDLEQIDADDLEEMDLKWTKVECYNCHRRCHFARECMAPRNQGNGNIDAPRRNAPVDTSTTNALVVQDGIGYQIGLESLEARIVVHEKNEAVYEEDIAFLKYGVQVKDISIKDLKNQLEEALKEKDNLILKLENFEESSKNLTKLINSQISAKDKTGIGYDSQMNENEVVHSVFNSRESEVDDSPVNDRFKIGKGFHAVPPPLILDIVENPKTVRPSAPIIEEWDTESDNNSVFRPKSDQTKPKFTKINFVKFGENVKTVNKENTHKQVEYLRKSQSPMDNRRNWNGMMTQKLGNGFESIKKACFVCGSLNHLIKDCDFHENKMVEKPMKTHKQVEYLRKSQSPRDNRRNWNGMMTQKLGNGFESIKKDCFVCGSLNHLIKDYDFHENKMVEKLVLNNKGRVTVQREIGPVWNNAQRVNHQNKLTHLHPKRNFVPTAVATKSGQVPINAAKQSSPRAAASISTVRLRAFNQKSAAKTNNFNEKVNIVRVNNVTTAGPKAVVSAAVGNGENVGNPQYTLQDQGIFNSRCSRHMTGNKSFLTNYQEIDGGFVAFGESPKGGKITRKGKIRTGKLDFEDVYFVKELKCDNGTEFKNRIMNEFCKMKGIRREFSVARTPQQNGVAKRKNRTLIEVARTMLADSKLLTTFWAGAVNTACYVQNKVLVIKPHNKTPYKLFLGRKPALSFMRPFGCPVTILNTLDHLGTGPNWMFDIDTLTMSMNYQPVFAGNQTNDNAGTKANINAGETKMNTVPDPQHVLLPFLTSDSQDPKSLEYEVANDAGKKNEVKDPLKEDEINGSGEATNTDSTNRVNTVSSPVNIVSSSFTTVDPGRDRDQRNEFESVFEQDKDANGNSTYKMFTLVSTAGSSYDNLGRPIHINIDYPTNADNPIDPLMPDLEDTTDLQDTGIFGNAYNDEDMGAEADFNNVETTMKVSPIPITIIH
ncbi:ribonuclease H-like domain-containing protein, partial [Tanacetum coccineum]